MKIVNKEAFNQNCYLIKIDNKLVAIDPGYNYQAIKKKLGNQKLAMILLTHYHFDHVGAVDDLCQEYNIKAYIHEKGFQLVQKSKMALYFGFPLATVKASNLVTFNNHINDLPSLKVIYAPGHSQDSTLFLIENKLFTGDVLFSNAFGRVDGPDSSKEKMIKSLLTIAKLSDDITIYPGHGPEQKLKFLKKSLTEFVTRIEKMQKGEING